MPFNGSGSGTPTALLTYDVDVGAGATEYTPFLGVVGLSRIRFLVERQVNAATTIRVTPQVTVAPGPDAGSLRNCDNPGVVPATASGVYSFDTIAAFNAARLKLESTAGAGVTTLRCTIFATPY